jgi:hypothetical protein
VNPVAVLKEMMLEGSYEMKAPPERIWHFIIDPNKISKCLPDLKSLEIESEDKFLAVTRVGVGPIRADLKFRIEITGKDPPSRVKLKADGSGSGSRVNLDISMELRQVAGGAQLAYKADVKVGGMMAGLGQRVMMDTAGKTVAGIFDCIKKQVEQA